MTSAEPARTTAYSTDIGWRVVWLRKEVGLDYKEIAVRLQIGIGTAHRIYHRYLEGCVYCTGASTNEKNRHELSKFQREKKKKIA